MPKIITFTANLLAETTYEYTAWERGKTQRAVGESFQVGGKGINVSKMLNRLEADNAAICFPGGRFGPMCMNWMRQAGLELMAFTRKCDTRSGSVIRSGDGEETTFLGVESIVSDEAIREMIVTLNRIEEDFVFAVCGSVQGWGELHWNPLRDWIANRGKNVTLVVDNYGPSLSWLTQQKPEIVKFNRDELELLFEGEDRALPTERLLQLAAERLGSHRWVVTNGGGAVWIKDGDAEPISIAPPAVECVSPTGCGDVFFATLIDCLYNKEDYDLESAARLAADYASRSAAQVEIAEFELRSGG